MILDKIAHSFESLRVFARTFLMGYLYLLYYLVAWAKLQPDITSAQTILVVAVTGVAAPITSFYISSGKLLLKLNKKDHVSLRAVSHCSFFLSRFRIFPLAFVLGYGYLTVDSILWAMELGTGLTNLQAGFVSILAGIAAPISGFYLSTGKLLIEQEDEVSKGKLNDKDSQDL